MREWIWKGEPQARNVQISLTASVPLLSLLLRRSTIDYFIEFSEVSDHASISKEIVSRSNPLDNDKDPTVCYSRDNKAALILEQENGSNSYREFEPTDISYDQSIMAQLRHPAKYHEITWLARQLYFAQIFREWSFGRNAGLRKPQQADLPGNRLLADASNLALIVNQVENWGKWQEFNELLKRFFPRFERLSTSVSAEPYNFYSR